MTQNTVTLIAATLAFSASILAVAATLYNARLSRFASERWWERKADAYGRILEALADVIYFYDQSIAAESEAQDLPEQSMSELLEHWQRGQYQLQKAIAGGAFLVSDEAESLLKAHLSAVESRQSDVD